MARATFWIVLLTGLLVAGFLLAMRMLAPPLLGQALGAVVLLYNVLLVLAAWLRSQHELLDAWLFLLPLSLCQLLADSMLVQQLGTLAFGSLGGTSFAGVPVYMAGLWVAPLLVVLWLAEMVHRRSAWLALAIAPVVAVAIFAAAEWAARQLGLWWSRGVDTYQGVALYVLPAEALLGLAAWLMFVTVQGRTIFSKAAGAAAVSLFYAGALVASHFVFTRILA